MQPKDCIFVEMIWKKIVMFDINGLWSKFNELHEVFIIKMICMVMFRDEVEKKSRYTGNFSFEMH